MFDLLHLTNKDPEFYPLIGPYLANRDVVRYVGDSIWDDDGKTWHTLTEQDRLVGFIATRSSGGLIVAESCYRITPRALPHLVQAAIDAADPSPMRTTVLRQNAAPYLAAGFTVTGETTRFLKLLRSAS